MTLPKIRFKTCLTVKSRHVHTTAIFGVMGFPYIVVLRIEEVACLYINSLWLYSQLFCWQQDYATLWLLQWL